MFEQPLTLVLEGINNYLANDTKLLVAVRNIFTGVYPRVSGTRQKLARRLPKAPFHWLNSHAYILMLLLEDIETSRNIYMTDTDVTEGNHFQ
jgi:hypothetical protein